MARGVYEKEREREREKERDRDRDRERDRRSRSRSRSDSRSRSPVYKKRKTSEDSQIRERSHEKKRYSTRSNDRYHRRSRSPKIRYRRKTSRENSAENVGNVLYVSNLSRKIKDEEIREKFSKAGKVLDVNVIRDPFTQDTRGFGFVTMESSKESQAAIDLINKTELDHRQVTVEFSKRSRPHESTPGIYLGPTVRKRTVSPGFKRRYRSRSRSRSNHREKNYRSNNNYSRSRSRSRSDSYKKRRQTNRDR